MKQYAVLWLCLMLGWLGVAQASWASGCVNVQDSRYNYLRTVTEMRRNIPMSFERIIQAKKLDERTLPHRKMSTVVTFGVNGNQEPTNMRIKSPSGSAIIDQAALEALPYSAPYRTPGGCYEISLDYYKADSKPIAQPSQRGDASKKPKGMFAGKAFSSGEPEYAGNVLMPRPVLPYYCPEESLTRWHQGVVHQIHNQWLQRPRLVIKGRYLLQIGALGDLKDVKVERSAGSGTLDATALSKIKGAAPFQPAPTDDDQDILFVFSSMPLYKPLSVRCTPSARKVTSVKVDPQGPLRAKQIVCKIRKNWQPSPSKELEKLMFQVTVGGNGVLKQVVLKVSSGNAALDETARAKIKSAAPFMPDPKGHNLIFLFQFNQAIQERCN